MKNSYLLLTIFFLALTSCSSDDAAPVTPEEPQTIKLVSQTIATGWAGMTTTSDWTYNGQKLVSIVSDNGTSQVFTYNGDQIVGIETTNEFGEVTNDTFEYDAQGRITVHYDLSVAWGRKEVYEYPDTDTVTVTKFFGSNLSQTQVVMTGTMEISNGEIVHTKTVNVDSGYARTCDYTYDNSNSPTRNITGYDKIAGLLATNQKGIMRNVLTNTQTTEGSPESVLVTKTYTYDQDNYPTRIASSDPLDGDSGIVQFVY
ncbi:MAG: hypothetical protein EOO01_19335 [Chitinophagaceae bacterium]|nr:MAG: hypothetical protein EOO01_19335 [Chitinophagaceae bacterium]